MNDQDYRIQYLETELGEVSSGVDTFTECVANYRNSGETGNMSDDNWSDMNNYSDMNNWSDMNNYDSYENNWSDMNNQDSYDYSSDTTGPVMYGYFGSMMQCTNG